MDGFRIGLQLDKSDQDFTSVDRIDDERRQLLELKALDAVAKGNGSQKFSSRCPAPFRKILDDLVHPRAFFVGLDLRIDLSLPMLCMRRKCGLHQIRHMGQDRLDHVVVFSKL